MSLRLRTAAACTHEMRWLAALSAGAAATPWLLAEIARRSEGRSLAANKRLIVDNAGLAGAVAAALAANR